MPQDLAKLAKEKGIRYFMISYTDLFGAQRAKLVPAAAIADMQKDGAGFAGFATWLDMTPADPDLFSIPDPESLIVLRRMGSPGISRRGSGRTRSTSDATAQWQPSAAGIARSAARSTGSAASAAW